MAKLTLRDAKIWFGQYDLSGHHNQLSLQATKAIQDSTAMGATWSTNLAGVLGASFSGGGFWDMTSPVSPDYEYYNATIGATSKIITLSADGGNDGEVAYTMQALNGEYTGFGAHGDPAPFAVNATADGILVRGIVLGNTSQTGTASGAAVLYLPVTAGQTLYAALHVFAMSATNATMIIEKDTTDAFGDADTVISFTSITAATSEWKTYTTAHVDTYYRYRISVWGGAGTITFAVAIGIV